METIDIEAVWLSLSERIGPLAMKLGGVLLILIVAWVISSWARRRMVQAFERRNIDLTLGRFFANVVRYGILLGAGLGCLGAFGIETTSFAAVIGAAGLAVGLAFQGTLSNFAAGAMLLMFRPFKVGDFVRVASVAGTCLEVELFTTQFRTPDGRLLIVPNSNIFGTIIENFSAMPERRVDVPVGTVYSADLDETRRVLEAAIEHVEGRIEEPASDVILKGLGASSIDWEVRVWCKGADYFPVMQRTIREVKVALDSAKIGIPFPQMDVHLDEVSVRRLDEPSRANRTVA